MTVRLAKDLREIVDHAVRSGLYTRESDVIRDALTRLSQTLPKDEALLPRDASATQSEKAPLTRAEFDKRLVELGLMSRIPDSEADFDDPDDRLIDIKGEPLSETVIRERR